MKIIILIVAVIGFIVTAANALQQQDRTSRLPQLLPAELQSDDWVDRAEAFEQVKDLNDNRTRNALIELLERENTVISEAALSGNPVSERYGEGYSEYYAQLLGIVEKHTADSPNQRALVALARGSYNPNSQFANWLAGQTSLIPTFLEMAKGNSPFGRENAVAVLGKMIAGSQDISVEVKQEIRQVIEHAQYDPESFVRRRATEVVEKLGKNKPQR